MENNCQVMVIHKSKLFLNFYPLQFPKPASDTLVALFSLWGQSQLLICPVYLIILWKYNSLIPLMCLLILADWGMRLALQLKVPLSIPFLIHFSNQLQHFIQVSRKRI